MKLYTGRGDYGNTNVIGGSTVKKTDDLVSAYGEIDELNSHIGVMRSMINNHRLGVELYQIQHILFDIGTMLADVNSKMNMKVEDKTIKSTEANIDYWSSMTSELKYFVLPGGSSDGSYAHLVRTVARRVERSVLKVKDVDRNALIYLNRLSDYFFVVARYLNSMSNHEEVYYKGAGEVFH